MSPENEEALKIARRSEGYSHPASSHLERLVQESEARGEMLLKCLMERESILTDMDNHYKASGRRSALLKKCLAWLPVNDVEDGHPSKELEDLRNSITEELGEPSARDTQLRMAENILAGCRVRFREWPALDELLKSYEDKYGKVKHG